MDAICAAAGATGAALLQTDIRTPYIPRTQSVDDCFKNYFERGWQTRDTRAERSLPLLSRGQPVVTDQDIVTPEEIHRLDFYNECALPFGLPWFAGIGLWAGSALWAMVVQRTSRQGPFQRDETRVLSLLAPRLTEAATLSKAVGQAALLVSTTRWSSSGSPRSPSIGWVSCLRLIRLGHAIFDNDFFVHNRRLVVRDQRAVQMLEDLVDQLRTTKDTVPLPRDPIVVRRRGKRPLVIRVLAVAGPARTPFLGARALLVISDLQRRSSPEASLLAETFGLPPAERRLASTMATGISIERAADQLGLSRATVRNQLKAVFAKTATNRQSELVALLSRL